MKNLKNFDKEVYSIITKEHNRQQDTIELIASENFCSEAVREAVGSVLCNKYTEGYPNNRYYGGCGYYDELEELCKSRWLQVFNANDDYHCNVQPHSGSSANLAVYTAFLKANDLILGMSLDAGGHLTHGSPVNFSGKFFDVVTYGLNSDGFIDYAEVEDQIRFYKPKIIIAGASSYSRTIDFITFRDIIDNCSDDNYKPIFMVDMSHIAGLVAAGLHQSPFGYADIITTTTHKTLRCARGGLIFCKKGFAKKIDAAVFPGTQGGSLMNSIAGKAVGALECLQPAYREYMKAVKDNTRAMCDEFIKLGYNVVSRGTDNHMFLINLIDTKVSGKDVQDACERNGITLNKNCVPYDPRGPKLTSGIRIGCAAETTKGKTKKDFIEIAHKIDHIIKSVQKAQGVCNDL